MVLAALHLFKTAVLAARAAELLVRMR